MTDDEYKDYLELKKMGIDAPELEAQVYDYLKKKEIKEAGENGEAGGSQAPFIDGVDWVGAYRKASGSDKHPSEDELDAFRESIGAKVTGFSKTSKKKKEYRLSFPLARPETVEKTVESYSFKKGDPKDIYKVAVQTGYYPDGEADEPYFGEFLKMGLVSDEEVEKKVKSGEWDKELLGEWERAKGFQNLLGSARDFVTKKMRAHQAKKDSDIVTETVFPSSVRTLKEGELPKKGQIAQDAIAFGVSSLPGVGTGKVVQGATRVGFPTIGALLSASNEYAHNDVPAGDAMKDAATMAVLGNVFNSPWAFREAASYAGLGTLRRGIGEMLSAPKTDAERQMAKRIKDAYRIAELVGSNPQDGAKGVIFATQHWDPDAKVALYRKLSHEGNSFVDEFANMAASDNRTSDLFDSYVRASQGLPVNDLIVEDIYKGFGTGNEAEAIKKGAELIDINELSGKFGDKISKLLMSQRTKDAAKTALKAVAEVPAQGLGRPALRSAAVKKTKMAEPQDSKTKRNYKEREKIETDEDTENRLYNLFRPRISETEIGDYISKRYNLFKGIR